MKNINWSKLQLVAWGLLITNILLAINGIFGTNINAQVVSDNIMQIIGLVSPIVFLFLNKLEWGKDMNVLGGIKR